MRTKLFAVLAALVCSHLLLAQPPEPATVSIGVLSLFHARQLVLTSARPLLVRLDQSTFVLAPAHPLTIRVQGSAAQITTTGLPQRSVSLLSTPAASLTLSVPGKLTRVYSGGLTITVRHGSLQVVISMPTETAVASIVAAESPPHASPAALEAQAIASRSFLLATPHPHNDFDACDTTHCQFLRSPPPAGSPAMLAALATRGLVLTWRASPADTAHIVAAMYSRSCGGHTRALDAATSGQYPYYAVRCDFCLRHPERWSRALPARLPVSESERLAFNRIHGWSALPSNFHHAADNALSGRGTGHGVGLCQLGAEDLARRGESFPAILAHFYPATVLTQLP